MGAAAAQMKSCVHIIGGHWKRSLLPAPSLSGVRPTPARVRETVFNWLGQRLEGYTCVDLFAGSGALGFEAASRGAARVTLVERHPRLVRQLRQTQAKLDARAIEIVRSDAMQFLTACAPQRFDIVFVDPPFNSALIERVLPLCRARARPEGVIYIESPKALRLFDAHCFGDWRIDRQGRAGAVHYALLRQEVRNS
ncbi:16S rRNA (guanine(966)-N(2))-methyltransferase RsmD [Candidatus Glomeribacter gigasporarum]|nr:16S rRNA (guanine(966)-N(2))-methyltransferase RsmD [Candidatus Glomeribacter gigasporarum]